MSRKKHNATSIIYITLTVVMLMASAQAFASTLNTVGNCNLPIWCPVTTPNQSGPNIFYGNAAVSNTDAWAAGINGTDFGTNTHPILQHWDGNSWTAVTPASVPANAGFFSAAATSSNDVWAVGYDNYSSPTIEYTLAQHWNGSSWTATTTPNADSGAGNALAGVGAITASDVWAVGAYNRGGVHQGDGIDFTLTEHWNGTSWSLVSSPNINPGNSYNELLAVAPVSSNNVWAVGFYTNHYFGDMPRPLIEHWDGTAWTIPSGLPNPGMDSILFSAAAVNANDIWAVGAINPFSTPQPFIVHWDGTSWTMASLPSINGGQLRGITITPHHDIWAVGSYLTNCVGNGCPPSNTPAVNKEIDSDSYYRNLLLIPANQASPQPKHPASLVAAPLAMHWQGGSINSWVQFPAAYPNLSGALYSVSAPLSETPGDITRMWAVGNSSDLNTNYTLADTYAPLVQPGQVRHNR